MTDPTITAGPFVNRDGKWTLIAKRGCLLVHVTSKDRATNYDITGVLTEHALNDLIRGLGAEFRIGTERATEVTLAYLKGSQ